MSQTIIVAGDRPAYIDHAVVAENSSARTDEHPLVQAMFLLKSEAISSAKRAAAFTNLPWGVFGESTVDGSPLFWIAPITSVIGMGTGALWVTDEGEEEGTGA